MLITTPQEFVSKWRDVRLKERAAAQEHFIDLCRLVGHPTPAEDDPTGERFTFEAGADKQAGGKGWADVWKRGFFGWEYKGKHANLDKAYQQLLQYRESLQNPPLLIVSDIDSIIVHTNFTNTIKQTVTLTFDDLLTRQGMDQLRAIFRTPEHFKAAQTTEQVTEQAAQEFARLSAILREQDHSSDRIAHFLIRLLFCLFAEDIGLLPDGLFTRLISQTRRQPQAFTVQLRQLFSAMAHGGWFGVDSIRHFNGGLFDDDWVLEMPSSALDILHRVDKLDWAGIEPSILGTLFERSLDPDKRSQLGAHYTSREDILLIVEPVLMSPLRRRWKKVKEQARDIAQRRDATSDPSTRTRRQNEMDKLLRDFAAELATVRVLDPACGSGNFLYVALKQMLDLWKELSVFAGEVGMPVMLPLSGISPSPEQLYGIEINPYAHELAQATVWIGYIQWLHENGFGVPSEPILKPLDNIKNMDAVLAYDEAGEPVEPEWPEVDVVIGNPPFLGGQKLRRELGNEYTDAIFALYNDRVPGAADLVCYWFERSREMISLRKIHRAGLLATQAIRRGRSRKVLERIKESGDIFMAWSNRPWVLDGASIRVAMVGFDNGSELQKTLDGKPVEIIRAGLAATIDLSEASRLPENEDIGFEGIKKNGPFEISEDKAKELLKATGNPTGRSNSEVVKPWFNGTDITKRSRGMWLVDFGMDISEQEAALYEKPFEYIKLVVKPVRMKKPEGHKLRENWWIFGRPRPAMKEAISALHRYIVTPRVAKHRLFAWVDRAVIPDGRLNVFARNDDYFFGVLHSSIHEVWSLANSSRHGVGNDPTYNNRVCFETFPFPWPSDKEPTDDPLVQAIAQAAKELVEKRDAWLNPPGLSEKELKKRTLTNLYNARPTWLGLAHRKLDKAVLAAYGWSDLMDDDGNIDEEEVLSHLLALNLKRAAAQSADG